MSASSGSVHFEEELASVRMSTVFLSPALSFFPRSEASNTAAADWCDLTNERLLYEKQHRPLCLATEKGAL